MAETIKKQLGLETELIKGSDGVFEVSLDNTLVYSKKATGEFPIDSFVIQTLRNRGV
ncbi:MAG: hypothetical protein GY786_15600 [Proteobacteria bacterium]|nr:hypothetical protein [Pseudomonadota bacterium]